jgi:hypothetical protein
MSTTLLPLLNIMLKAVKYVKIAEPLFIKLNWQKVIDFICKYLLDYAIGFMGTPRKFGKVKDTTKLDAAFFRMSPKQANAMDAQQRLLLEVAYECIVDAGE